ncbi:hypothetical protein D3C81_1460660 [compost metagenome]
MTKNVSSPINARPLSVPHSKDAFVLTLTANLGLLGTPDCSGGQVFIHTRYEDRVMLLKQLLGFAQLVIKAP